MIDTKNVRATTTHSTASLTTRARFMPSGAGRPDSIRTFMEWSMPAR